MQEKSPVLPLAVVLSYFDKIIGPSTLHIHPSRAVPDEVVKEVTSIIDKVTVPGFFTQSSGGYTAVNDYFEIPSAWARGAKEAVLLSFILPGKVTPDIEVAFQSHAKDFENKVTQIQIPEIYKGFYKNDEGRYQEGDRAVIREIHQLLVSWVNALLQTATVVIVEIWSEKLMGELQADTPLNNPLFILYCATGHGLDVLSAVGKGGKTRQDIVGSSGLDRSVIDERIPYLISLDLLTEGVELVLTNRGRKLLQSSVAEKLAKDFSSLNPLLRLFLISNSPFPAPGKADLKTYYVLSAIHQGAQTVEELQRMLRNNSQEAFSRRLNAFIRYLMDLGYLEKEKPLALTPAGMVVVEKTNIVANKDLKESKAK